MSVLSLLSTLDELNISVELLAGNLRINAPEGALTPALTDELKRKKSEIVEFLKKNTRDQVGYISIEPVEKKEYYPLSSAQKRMFILQQIENENIGYNMPYAFFLTGDLDPVKPGQAFKKLITRHEGLRTSFEMVNEEPGQKIHKEVEFEVEYYDLMTSPEGRTPADIIERFIRVFDLSSAPILRAGIIKTEPLKHIMMVDMHHIITDGMSQGIFMRDFISLFTGDQLPGLKLQYKDYSAWQLRQARAEDFKNREEYWLKEFEGDIPLLNMPYDFPRPALQSFAGGSVSFDISMAETRALNEIAHREGATLFMVILAVYTVFLSKISNQEDIVVGIPIAGRQHADLEQIIGIFINMLAVRNHVTGEYTFIKLLGNTKKKSLAAFENQAYPFEDLVEKAGVERDISRNPLFDVIFLMQNIFTTAMDISEQKIGDLGVKPYSYEGKISRFDLDLTVVETGQKLQVHLVYCSKLFKEETILRFAGYFKKIVSSVVKHPEEKISGIEIITEEEKKKVLYEFNDTETAYPQDKTISRLFAEQVERIPWHIAVFGQSLAARHREAQGRGEAVSYKHFNEKANRLAGFLSRNGVKPGVIVGVMVERSIEMMVGILGILKAGGAYLPIEPQSPGNRIRYMLRDCRAKLLLTSRSLKKEVEKFRGRGEALSLCYINECFAPTCVRPSGKTVVPDDTEPGVGARRAVPSKPAACNPQPVTSPLNLAYIIYTSGSTGNPKGVMIENRALVNFIKGITDIIAFEESDSILSLTTISFDIFGLETVLPLTKGAKVVIGTKDEQLNPEAAARAMAAENVSILQVTPSHLLMLISNEESWTGLKDLKYLLVGGEPFPGPTLEQARKVRAGGKIYNMYGPTETTIWSTLKEVTEGETLNIGKPIANTRVYILGKSKALQPLGIAGDLYIAGAGLARGYINKPELTGKKFTANPYEKGGYLYNTGDVAKWLTDGSIDFLGRIDDQVKIRGFRIELGEIENQLRQHEDIKEAVVTTVGNGDKCLCAYYVGEKEIKSGDLQDYLLKELPGYMIPTYFIPLERIPLTSSGKINKRALPAPAPGKSGDEYIAPRNKTEEKLAEIWSAVLGIKKEVIGIDANFFDLGGHSLRAAVMAARVHKELNVKVPVTQIFRTPAIRSLAGYIGRNREEKFLAVEAVEKKIYYPLSSAQHRLYFMYLMNPGSISYNIPFVLVLTGKIDGSRLAESLSKLVDRHESLRTSFTMVNEGVVQRIHEPGESEFAIEYYELDPQYPAAESIIRKFVRPFDLACAPLLKVGLIKEQEDRHIFMIDMHHIITDGVSLEILARDFMLLYARKPLPLLKLQYKDFSGWQNRLLTSGEMKRQEEYWLGKFSGAVPALDLVDSFSGTSGQSAGEAGRVSFNLERQLNDRIYEIMKRTGATAFMFLLAALNVLLFKYTGAEDIVVGSPTTGRNHTDLYDIIGMFVNMLAFRNSPAGGKTFIRFLEEVKENILESYENQDYQFDELVKKLGIDRDTSSSPLFNVVLAMQNFDLGGDNTAPLENSDTLKAAPYEYEDKISRFDLTIFISETRNGINLVCRHSGLYDWKSIEKMAGHYSEIVDRVTKNVDIKLSEITLSSDLLFAAEAVEDDEDVDFSF